jgi:hypothetical protein
MIKRAAALSFLLLATIILLAHAVVPHHHHENEVCIVNFHGKTDLETHSHGTSDHNHGHSHEHEHDGENNTENCALKQVFVVPSNQVKQECKYLDYSDNRFRFNEFQAVLSNKGLYSIFPKTLSKTQLIFIPSAYSRFADIRISLRGPPIA